MTVDGHRWAREARRDNTREDGVVSYSLEEALGLRECIKWRKVAGATPRLVCEQRLLENVKLHAHL